MKTRKLTLALAGAMFAAVALAAPPASARGWGIDPNGLWAGIVSWFTGDETSDLGVVIDPNG